MRKWCGHSFYYSGGILVASWIFFHDRLIQNDIWATLETNMNFHDIITLTSQDVFKNILICVWTLCVGMWYEYKWPKKTEEVI